MTNGRERSSDPHHASWLLKTMKFSEKQNECDEEGAERGLPLYTTHQPSAARCVLESLDLDDHEARNCEASRRLYQGLEGERRWAAWRGVMQTSDGLQGDKIRWR